MEITETNHSMITACIEKNPFYEFFRNDFFKHCTAEIHQTPWRDKDSEKSLTFDNCQSERPNNEEICEKLIDIFDIQEPELFREKFHKQTVKGSGNEGRKIMTLHSSSLLSLLCFYGVEKNQIQIPINTEGLPKGITFDLSRFEEQHKITKAYCGDYSSISHSNPSNMDVVLRSTEHKYELFLESKFSEYLKNGLVSGIKDDVYKDMYVKLEGTFLKDAVLKIEDEKDENGNDTNTFKLRADGRNTKQYLQGIKQMISHFMAVCNYAYENKDHDKTIILGTVLYRFNNQKFSNYSNLYWMLMNALKELLPKEIDNLILLDTPLTYQDIFSKNSNINFLDDKVAQYYRLGNYSE